MSTYYSIVCVTCDPDANVRGPHAWGWWNRGAPQLRDLILSMSALAALGRAPTKDIYIDIVGNEQGGDICTYAVAHDGHHLRVKSEYGNFADECPTFWECPMCHHRKPCRLSPEHAGEHDPKAPT